jgi:hypothetical protein
MLIPARASAAESRRSCASKRRNRIRRLRGQGGQGLLEFAMIFPIIVVMLAIVFDIGLALNHRATLQHAAREGARMAAVSDGSNCQDIRDRIHDQSQNLVPADNTITFAYQDLNGDGKDDAGDNVDVNIPYDYQPKFLQTAFGMFGLTAGSFNMDVTGSSRVERTVASVC